MKPFGAKLGGVTYSFRPGGYGLAWQPETRQLLLVETVDGLEIPGGGKETGETMEGALKREFLEETGHRITRSRPLLCLRQFMTKPDRGKCYDKYCTFFLVTVDPASGPPEEEGHRPFWCAPEEAVGRMAEECQEWLLRCLLEPDAMDFDISGMVVDFLKESS